MIEGVSQTAKIENNEAIRVDGPAVQTARSPSPPESTLMKEQVQQPAKKETEDKKEHQQIDQAFLDELNDDIEVIHNIGLRFSIHEPTGRTVVRVINKDNDETVREIPDEKILDLAAKLDEMMGIMFDTTV